MLFGSNDGAAVHTEIEGPLHLSSDRSAIQAGFAEWLDNLQATAVLDGPTGRWPEEDISFRRIPGKPRREVEFWIGGNWDGVVQINEPSTPASENPLGGLATDGAGRRYIVRQGTLHENRISERLSGDVFRDRTGLTPVAVSVGGVDAKRQWYVVTSLDGVTPNVLRASTADFVARCWNARTWEGKAADDQPRLQALFGTPETGGWYTTVPNPDPITVWREQGAVWERLAAILKPLKLELKKPRHASGYEVDGVISGEPPILVEIKTSTAASDIYTGVGQLMLYPRILPDLHSHLRILLLPGGASPALLAAVRATGVEVHTYTRSASKGPSSIRFAREFLIRCGVPADKANDLGAP